MSWEGRNNCNPGNCCLDGPCGYKEDCQYERFGVLGVPANLIFTPDAWYYSILPTLTTAVSGAGVGALSVARVSLLGQMTLGFPGSPLLPGSFLLPAMINMEFPDYQKKWQPYAWGVSIVMIIVALISGCVTL